MVVAGLVALAVIAAFAPLILLLFWGSIICTMNTKVILKNTAIGDAVRIQIKLGFILCYQAQIHLEHPILYEAESDHGLRFPPSLVSAVQAPYFSEKTVRHNMSKVPLHLQDVVGAACILRGTLLGLWAMEAIEFCQQVTRRDFFGIPVDPDVKWVIRIGYGSNSTALGRLECHLLDIIDQWEHYPQPEHRRLMWQPTHRLENVVQHVSNGDFMSLAHQVMWKTRQTALNSRLATPTDKDDYVLSINPQVRNLLAEDVDRLGAVGQNTHNYYHLIEREIVVSIANLA